MLLRTGLLEQSALSSEELSALQLVRGVRLLGDRTPLQLAQEATALKFVSSTITQVPYWNPESIKLVIHDVAIDDMIISSTKFIIFSSV